MWWGSIFTSHHLSEDPPYRIHIYKHIGSQTTQQRHPTEPIKHSSSMVIVLGCSRLPPMFGLCVWVGGEGFGEGSGVYGVCCCGCCRFQIWANCCQNGFLFNEAHRTTGRYCRQIGNIDKRIAHSRQLTMMYAIRRFPLNRLAYLCFALHSHSHSHYYTIQRGGQHINHPAGTPLSSSSPSIH